MMILKSHELHKVLIILCFFSAAYLINGCSADKLPRNLDTDGLLLYEKQGWFFVHGYFPDLWVLDPSNGRRYKITRGGPYNVHPSWVSGADRVIFESKRQRDHGGVSHLYVLNTRSGRYVPFHRGMDLNRVTGALKENTVPAVNNATGRVYYHSGSCRCIVSETLSGNDYQETPIQMDLRPTRMFWSDDYRHLVVQSYVRGQPRRNQRYRPSFWEIIVYDAHTWEDTFVLARDGWNFHPGDLYNGNLIYRKREFKQGAKGEIYIHNIHNGEKNLVFRDTADFMITESVFLNDTTLYVMGYSNTQSKPDIYKFDIGTSTSTQLTNDGRSKSNLTIYRTFVLQNQ